MIMTIEGKVIALELKNFGFSDKSEFVMTLETLGDTKVVLDLPIARHDASYYKLGQVVKVDVLVTEHYTPKELPRKYRVAKKYPPESFPYDELPQPHRDPELFGPQPPQEEYVEYPSDEELDIYDDEDEVQDDAEQPQSKAEEIKQQESSAQQEEKNFGGLEDILNDKSDDMTNEEIARKLGKEENVDTDPVDKPKVDNMSSQELTQSDYEKSDQTSQETQQDTVSGQQENDDGQEETESQSEQQDHQPEEENSEKTDEGSAPLGGSMMGGFAGNEDIDDDEEEE
ncbi:hypothetical protein [Ligilactobacillus murinus]|uniref:hypothetical protein n=1 Tax=Ligilactobacillus murinus TaxID=1622 RepID=UPI001094544F|nr:hypothetical protein [Ligilactobacillus murinus]TGY53948.1 hypothetical protein E5341_00615 [Ligilactobacillus murinus]